MKREKIKMAIDTRLFALHGTLESRARIMGCVKEKKIVSRKLSYPPVIVAVILMALIMLAFGSNLFGLFAEKYDTRNGEDGIPEYFTAPSSSK